MSDDLTSLLTALAVPFAVSWVLTAGFVRWAPRLGLVDVPDDRKVHKVPTPRAGGVAIVTAFFMGGLLFPLEAWWFYGLGIAALGLADDLRPIPWQARLGVQTGVAALAVFTTFAAGPPLQVAVVVWTVGLINAFNMLDNMDLLSAGTAWIAAGCLVVQALLAGDPAAAWPYLMLMWTLLGFLWFNRPPARIFMGDAGSTFLGFVLGVGSVQAVVGKPGPAWWWAVPVCLLAVPWYDLITVVSLRLAQGRSPFHADKQHLSHRLVASGLGSTAAVGVIHLLALGSGLSALALWRASGAEAAGLVGAGFVAWWTAVALKDYHVIRRFVGSTRLPR